MTKPGILKKQSKILLLRLPEALHKAKIKLNEKNRLPFGGIQPVHVLCFQKEPGHKAEYPYLKGQLL
jgi:hypothetical protein